MMKGCTPLKTIQLIMYYFVNLQIIMRVLWFGETIKQAIDAARIHHQLLPPHIYYESAFPEVKGAIDLFSLCGRGSN